MLLLSDDEGRLIRGVFLIEKFSKFITGNPKD